MRAPCSEPLTPTLPPRIIAPLDPAHCQHPVSHVAGVQTIGEWVVMSGDFAYKSRQTIRQPSWTSASLALRHRTCEMPGGRLQALVTDDW